MASSCMNHCIFSVAENSVLVPALLMSISVTCWIQFHPQFSWRQSFAFMVYYLKEHTLCEDKESHDCEKEYIMHPKAIFNESSFSFYKPVATLLCSLQFFTMCNTCTSLLLPLSTQVIVSVSTEVTVSKYSMLKIYDVYARMFMAVLFVLLKIWG